jgi:hypothetical protein
VRRPELLQRLAEIARGGVFPLFRPGGKDEDFFQRRGGASSATPVDNL